MADLNKAFELDPESERILNRRAAVHYHKREYAKAVRDHMEALKLDPNSAETFNSLAWLWSTVPDPTIRNGRRAVDCATRACELTEFTNPNYLDSLAAADAEIGKYEDAVHWIDKALDLENDAGQRAEYESRREKYLKRQPLRVTPD